MSEYIIIYRGGGRPETPEAGQEHMKKWRQWMMDLGEAIVNPGTPFGKSSIVSASGVSGDAGANAANGYTIVKADSEEAAMAMAKACPHLNFEGATLEVAPLMDMKMT